MSTVARSSKGSSQKKFRVNKTEMSIIMWYIERIELYPQNDGQAAVVDACMGGGGVHGICGLQRRSFPTVVVLCPGKPPSTGPKWTFVLSLEFLHTQQWGLGLDFKSSGPNPIFHDFSCGPYTCSCENRGEENFKAGALRQRVGK